MATAAQVAKASLQKILAQATEAPIEASELQDFIFGMNAYMLDLDASGVSLGYTVVTDGGDDVTVPDGALRGVIYNMAVEMAPEFDGTITPVTAKIASDSMKTMRLLGQTMGESRFPSTLPIGSGNEGCNSRLSRRFYPDQQAEILAETTGSISLEVDTNEVADG
jgi:hypothetical protein